MESTTAYIGLGSNLGHRRAALDAAVTALQAVGEVLAVSSFYDTAPRYVLDQPRFLNAVVAVQTSLSAPALLEVLQAIESAGGRVREGATRFGPRRIDLDMLLYGDLVLDTPTLRVPHPRMLERLFVLAPLAEIAPELLHPVAGRTIIELADEAARHETTNRREGPSVAPHQEASA